MDSKNIRKTNIIVLKKNNFRESSIIIKALSPKFGLIDFIVKGEKRISKSHMPSIDLFKELYIKYRLKKDGLHNILSFDIIKSFDKIAENPYLFLETCSIAKFILDNCYPEMEYTYLYNAFLNYLQKATTGKKFIFPQAIIKTIYLYENGLLPINIKDKRRIFLKEVIKYGLSFSNRIENIDNSYWTKFMLWLDKQAIYYGIKI